MNKEEFEKAWQLTEPTKLKLIFLQYRSFVYADGYVIEKNDYVTLSYDGLEYGAAKLTDIKKVMKGIYKPADYSIEEDENRTGFVRISTIDGMWERI